MNYPVASYDIILNTEQLSYTTLCLNVFPDIDECNNTNCNGGDCINTAGSYMCDCLEGFTGDNCERGNPFC